MFNFVASPFNKLAAHDKGFYSYRLQGEREKRLDRGLDLG